MNVELEMPKIHKIQDYEWLRKIARNYQFTSDDPLVEANPKLEEICAGNYDVLPRGYELTIPTPKAKA